MNKTMKFMSVAVFAGLLALAAWAGPDAVVCTLSLPSDGGTISTSTCASSWVKNSTVLMQCTDSVYLDVDGTSATSADFKVDFVNSLDPVLIYLRQNQQHVQVALETASSGKVCKFGVTPVPKPESRR
jgi:hypothetical protein